MSIVNITSGVYNGTFPDYATNPDNTLPQVGDSSHIAYGNNTIARWAAPLFKDYDTPTQIPILAYHISGIDRIEFQLNNGITATVKDPSYNPTIGVTCYNINLDSSIPDNEFNELRAIVYPVSGWPQVLQGEVMGSTAIAPGIRNIRYGHHSYFFATNFNRTLSRKEYYINYATGSDANNGLTPQTPKLTMESALIAAGGTPKEVDGVVLYLMDNNGQRVDYTMGHPDSSLLVGNQNNRVNNLKRYVTITPYQNANVVMRGTGSQGSAGSFGLFLNKYRFLNLKIDQDSRSIPSTGNVARTMAMASPKSKTFTNPSNGKIYTVQNASQGAVHILIENCTFTANHNPLFDWPKTRADYVRQPGVNDFDPFRNQIPANIDICVTEPNTGESANNFRQRACEWWYKHSGATYHPNWSTNTPSVNQKFEEGWPFPYTSGVSNSVVFQSTDASGIAIIGSTFSDLWAFTKNPQIYLMNNCHLEKVMEDGYRDVRCLVNCSISDVLGHPINSAMTLTKDVFGLGESGDAVPGYGHADVYQHFPGFGGQARNLILNGVVAKDYYCQGPFFEASASFPGFTFNLNIDFLPQYEQVWAEYNTPPSNNVPPAGISSSMIRDVVIDNCTFMQNNKSSAQMIGIVRCMHGNFILQDSTIGKTNYQSSSSAYRYDRAFDGISAGPELEVIKKQFFVPMRPSLVKRCFTGTGPDQDLNKLFFQDTIHNVSYKSTHGREKWISEGRPEYWVTDPIQNDMPGVPGSVFIPGSVIIYDQRATLPPNPPPTSNHPITISLTTTDIDKTISWDNKNSFFGITHGPDSFYSTESVIQIPNYLERIEDITDPEDHPSIGPSRSNEISGNTFIIGNQGGVYVTGGTVDITLNTTIGAVNSINIKNLATKFQSTVRTAGGNTFAVILHGKTIPSTVFGEFKYLAAPFMTLEDWTDLGGNDPNIDVGGIPYEDFYKKFAYISFHSKEALVNQSITSNQFSFRKSPHHVYLNFTQSEMNGLSLSNGATGLSYIDLVTGTPAVQNKISKLQALPTGITCNINSYSGEFTSANKSNEAGTNPSTVTCNNKIRKFVGVVENGNKIVFQGTAASGTNSIFSGTNRYEHNGGIGSVNPLYQQTAIDDPTSPHYTLPTAQTIHFRLLNPVSFGSKNLLAYKVPVVGGKRLFGASPNIGITAGSYVRISGSASNNGIYQVLSTIDGIDQDVSSNTANSGSTEYQYLELSRIITAQEQAVGNNIKIENVSHLPILHVKYRQPV